MWPARTMDEPLGSLLNCPVVGSYFSKAAMGLPLVEGLVERFKQDFDVLDVDGARVALGNGAWFLVRASNTTPNLTVRFEAETRREIEHARDLLMKTLENYPDADGSVLKEEV